LLTAYTIGLGGYVSGASSQSGAALTSIRVAAGALPAAVILTATAVMLTYPLSEKTSAGWSVKVAARRAVGRPQMEAGAAN
jgi:glucuronide carrier protein